MWVIHGQILTDDEILYIREYSEATIGHTVVVPNSISYERLLELHGGICMGDMRDGFTLRDDFRTYGGKKLGSHCEAIHGYRDERHERPTNKQIGGDHYSKHIIQPIDVIREYSMDFFEGNALKYLLRYKEKNGVEDLLKCKDYIDMIIDNVNTKENG